MSDEPKHWTTLANEKFAEQQAQQQAEPLSPEKDAYVRSLASTTEAVRAADAEKDAVWERATDNFKADVESQSVRNIHQAREVTFSTDRAKKEIAAGNAEGNAAPSTDFDAPAFEGELGLVPTSLEKLQIRYHKTAIECARGLATACAAASDDASVEQWVSEQLADEESAPKLQMLMAKCRAEVDSWNHPTFGNSTTARTPEQSAAVAELVHHTFRQIVGQSRRGLPMSKIEHILRRARLSTGDSDYRPAARQQSGQSRSQSQPQPKIDPTAPKNIHEALARSPLGR